VACMSSCRRASMTTTRARPFWVIKMGSPLRTACSTTSFA
jgi:hypothetical protein